MAGSIEPRAKIVYFSWLHALVGKYEILHLHWPEDLFRAKKKAVRVLKYGLFGLLAMRIKISRTPVIWTVHNNAPHEGVNWFESILLKVCMSMVTKRVFMTAAQREMFGDAEHDLVIRHGHYRDSYPPVTAKRKEKGRHSFLYFGFVRRYKGVEKLIESFSLLPSAPGEYKLTIAGRPNPSGYGHDLLVEYGNVPNVQWLLDFQSQENTSNLFAVADVIVLPYKKMINSGALLLALSFGKPVLAPRNDVTREIQAEVGAEWLYLYDGDITDKDLLCAVASASANLAGTNPDLSLREWASIGAEYRAAYKCVASREDMS